jgi:Spy/CpxP family protein refolding chaperone
MEVKMFKKLSIIAVLFVFAFSILSAQEKPNQMPGHQPFGVLGKLNLTDEQKSKMRDMKSELQKKQIALRSKIQIMRVEVKQLITADKLDKLAVEKKFNEIAKLQVEQKINLLNERSAINDILTPEQQKIWKECRNMRGMRGKMMIKDRIRGRMGTGMRRGIGEMMMPQAPDTPGQLNSLEPRMQMGLLEALGPESSEEFDTLIFDEIDPFVLPDPDEPEDIPNPR